VDHTSDLTWPTIELPILRAAIAAYEIGHDLTRAARAAVPQLTDRHFNITIEALHDAGYLKANVVPAWGETAPIRVSIMKPMPDAHRAVDRWPTANALVAQLAAAFEQAAADETDVERKLSYCEAAKAIVTGVATTAISKYMGL